jgi:hypothetical protein
MVEINSFLGGLLAGVLGTWVAFRLRASHEAGLTASRVRRNLRALKAEIDYGARLAGTYSESPFKAPLYRFPRAVFEAVYPTLIAETLIDADVTGLTGFYSQVDQMNRGLDAVERLRTSKQDDLTRELIQGEVDRLILKAAEMRHPSESLQTPGSSGFYTAAIQAVLRHLP